MRSRGLELSATANLASGWNLIAAFLGSTYNNTNAAKVGDYTVFDAALRYDFGARSPSLKGWTADLTVRNLFDKDYVASCTYACFYGEGRTVLGRVTYKW